MRIEGEACGRSSTAGRTPTSRVRGPRAVLTARTKLGMIEPGPSGSVRVALAAHRAERRGARAVV